MVTFYSSIDINRRTFGNRMVFSVEFFAVVSRSIPKLIRNYNPKFNFRFWLWSWFSIVARCGRLRWKIIVFISLGYLNRYDWMEVQPKIGEMLISDHLLILRIDLKFGVRVSWCRHIIDTLTRTHTSLTTNNNNESKQSVNEL